MPTFRKGRSSIVVVAVLAMMVSMLALPVGAATVGDVEFPATWSACPAGSVASAGFGDTAGSFAAADIDCIAMYKVTLGTAAGVYSPAAVVTREQMALFLVRAAGPAGITVPAASDQGFTDISGLKQESQDAINQAAALGFTKGTTATTYSPADPVSRYQMTLFLVRFLEKQNGAASLAASTVASGFTDTGAVSFEAYNAIETAYDHGITKGTTKTLFSPFAAVTREQMGAFIARTLGHTNARPAGISFQADKAAITAGDKLKVTISVRDAAFAPVVDALVDVFWADLDDKADALKADGTCDTTVVEDQFGGTECLIELGEPTATDANGNINATITEGADFTGDSIWWAWTGAAGATFDVDTTPVAAVEVTVAAAPTQWVVTTSIPKYAELFDGGNQVKYGTSVTHTFQLSDATGKALAVSGKKVTLALDTYVNGALTDVSAATATSDANGMLSFTLTNADPAAVVAGDGDETTVEVSVITLSGYGLNLTKVPNNDPDITWNDDASLETTLVGASSNDYIVASDSGSGAANSVTGTLYDQYGLGMAGKTVGFTSDDADGIDNVQINRTTNSAGVATLGYNRDAATSSLEVVVATNAVTGDAADVDVYWVIEESDGAVEAVALVILVADADNDRLVVQETGGDYVYLDYDSNDQFNISGATTYAAFDKAVGGTAPTVTNVAYNTYKNTASAVSSFTGS